MPVGGGKNILFLLLLLLASVGSLRAVTPANPNSTLATRRVYNYLAQLSAGTASSTGIIVGQSCLLSQFPGQPDDRYSNLFENLKASSGQYEGMLDMPYCGRTVNWTGTEIAATNAIIKQHWDAGGLVTLHFNTRNPFDARVNTSWSDPVFFSGENGWGNPTHNADQTEDLTLLITPGNTYYDYFTGKLDQAATGLLALQAEGVVVLWRPFQEHNSNQCWWGKKGGASADGQILEGLTPAENAVTSQPFIAMWRFMVNYFKAKGVNNILWVWSPSSHKYYSTYYYPGDEYVDIVAGTQYHDETYITSGTLPYNTKASYNDWLSYGKPVGISEWGSTINGALSVNGSLDTRKFITGAEVNYPKAAYFVAWASWIGNNMAIYHNQYYNDMMVAPYALTRAKTIGKWQATGTGNVIANGGFESENLSAWQNWGGFAAVESNAHTGTWSGEFANLTNGSGGAQTVVATPDTLYIFSAWVKKTGTQGAWLEYSFYNAAGTKIGNTTAQAITTTAYAQKIVYITTPANTSKVMVDVWNSSGGTVNLDDVSLTTVENKLANSGFETGVLSPWSVWGAASNFTVVTGSAKSGTKSGQFANNPNGCGGAQYVAASENTVYSLSAWVKKTGPQQAWLQCIFYNSSGAQIPGTALSLSISDAAYAQKIQTFTTPAGTKTIGVGVWNSAGGTVNLDEVHLTVGNLTGD